MERQTVRISVVLGLGLGLAWVLLWWLGGGLHVAQAQGPDTFSVYYVAPGGACNGAVPCYDSVQAAVDAVDDPGDVVKVAAGTYSGIGARPVPAGYGGPPASGVISQVVFISKTLAVQGGYTPANWTLYDPELNPTTLDALGQGRVLFITGDVSPTIEGLRLTGGDAAGLGGQVYGSSDSGGGVYLHGSAATLRDNVIWDNGAPGVDSSGGGLFMWSSDARVSGNVFTGNFAYYGGGLHAEESFATIEGNRVWDNVAGYSGGGLSIFVGASTIVDNEVFLNDAGYQGGGLYLSQDVSILSANQVYSNVTQMGGGWYLVLSDARLAGNQTYANRAFDDGGGLYLEASDATLINNVIVDNQAGDMGGGLCIAGSFPQLLHTTIARNTGLWGEGVYVTDQGGVHSSPILTNTIVADQAIGILVNTAGSTVALESTLWYGNGQDVNGPAVRSNDRWGDPAFVDPDGGDYHLFPTSAAIDGGVDAGVGVDLDGEPRPSGAGYDLGADELPGVSRYSLDVRVAASSDDAEERQLGYV